MTAVCDICGAPCEPSRSTWFAHCVANPECRPPAGPVRRPTHVEITTELLDRLEDECDADWRCGELTTVVPVGDLFALLGRVRATSSDDPSRLTGPSTDTPVIDRVDTP